jgi:uncharacterized membrane protein
MEAKKMWFLINVFLPITPLILRGFLKILWGHSDFEAINSAELFFVLGIISLLIIVDLKFRTFSLDNEDKIEERKKRAIIFIIIFVVTIFLSASSEIIHIEVIVERKIEHLLAYRVISIFAILSAFALIHYSIKTQEEFGLKYNLN